MAHFRLQILFRLTRLRRKKVCWKWPIFRFATGQFLARSFPGSISPFAGKFKKILDFENFLKIFQKFFSKFSKNFNFFSAEKNWQMLLDDLVGFLQQEQQKRQWKSISDYMKLQVSIFSRWRITEVMWPSRDKNRKSHDHSKSFQIISVTLNQEHDFVSRDFWWF